MKDGAVNSDIPGMKSYAAAEETLRSRYSGQQYFRNFKKIAWFRLGAVSYGLCGASMEHELMTSEVDVSR